MDIVAKINEIMKQQGMNEYQLAKLSGLSPSTIRNINKRGTVPSIPTLESICSTFHMTLSQFFSDSNTVFYPIESGQQEFLDLFIQLNPGQQTALITLMKTMTEKPKK